MLQCWFFHELKVWVWWSTEAFCSPLLLKYTVDWLDDQGNINTLSYTAIGTGITSLASAGVVQLAEHHPRNQNVTSLIPGWGTLMGWRFGPWGIAERNQLMFLTSVFLLLPSSLPSSLSKIRNKMLKKKELLACPDELALIVIQPRGWGIEKEHMSKEADYPSVQWSCFSKCELVEQRIAVSHKLDTKSSYHEVGKVPLNYIIKIKDYLFLSSFPIAITMLCL